jgi:hypothetical protein
LKLSRHATTPAIDRLHINIPKIQHEKTFFCTNDIRSYLLVQYCIIAQKCGKAVSQKPLFTLAVYRSERISGPEQRN